MKLYYHKTDGGAEYLTDTFIEFENTWKKGGKQREGVVNDDTRYVVRIDGNIKEDAELMVRE
jgi:hypothetical protein